jgi:hypothetical protein
MTCHNSRNGARGDYVANPASGISAPHEAMQTDVFLGVNAFFMGAGGQVSKHAAVEDTCAGCHVKLHPDSTTVANTNHTFEADGTICNKCHADGVGLEALEGQFLVSRAGLEAAMATAFASVTGGATPDYWVLAINPVVDAGSACTTACSRTQLCDATTVPATPVCAPKTALVEIKVAPTSIVPSGRTQYLTLSFAGPVANPFGTGTVGSVTTSMFNVAAGAVSPKLNPSSGGFATSLFSKTGIMAKTNWNYWLISSTAVDEAGNPTPAADVIHNPTFVFNVLSATTGKLLGAGGVGL